MSKPFEIPSAIRLTGRISQSSSEGESLELAPLRDNKATIPKLLEIHVDEGVFPVRVELHDFEQDGVRWTFCEVGRWRRGEGNYAWAEFESFQNPSGLDTITATAGEAKPEAEREKSKQIYIKIKPIVVGPDES